MREATTLTDSTGVIHFPAREIRASALSRLRAIVSEWREPQDHVTSVPQGSITAWAPGYRTAASQSDDLRQDSIVFTLVRDTTWRCP